ncbi:hypothetical protein Tco_0382063 [Tanacetum coccineum]
MKKQMPQVPILVGHHALKNDYDLEDSYTQQFPPRPPTTNSGLPPIKNSCYGHIVTLLLKTSSRKLAGDLKNPIERWNHRNFNKDKAFTGWKPKRKECCPNLLSTFLGHFCHPLVQPTMSVNEVHSNDNQIFDNVDYQSESGDAPRSCSPSVSMKNFVNEKTRACSNPANYLSKPKLNALKFVPQKELSGRTGCIGFRANENVLSS